jgi:hypothetical protein
MQSLCAKESTKCMLINHQGSGPSSLCRQTHVKVRCKCGSIVCIDKSQATFTAYAGSRSKSGCVARGQILRSQVEGTCKCYLAKPSVMCDVVVFKLLQVRSSSRSQFSQGPLHIAIGRSRLKSGCI